jgi:hypothetical protein
MQEHEETEESRAKYALCLEALEACQEPLVYKDWGSDIEMTPLPCYYTEDGHPYYPDMKLEDEPWVLEFDAEGSMHI